MVDHYTLFSFFKMKLIISNQTFILMDFMHCGLFHAKQPDFCDLPYHFWTGLKRFNFIFFGGPEYVRHSFASVAHFLIFESGFPWLHSYQYSFQGYSHILQNTMGPTKERNLNMGGGGKKYSSMITGDIMLNLNSL